MDNIKIEIARADQHEAILNFLLEYFRVDEPISRSIHLSKEDAGVFLSDLVDDGLAKPVSFVAVNDKNKIVGCRLNEIADFDAPDRPPVNSDRYSDNAKKVITFLDMLMKDLKTLLPPGTKRILKFIIVSVHPDYQRRGIAKQLIERSMRLASEQGCQYVSTGATAARSQQLFHNKLAFETLRTLDYKEYKDTTTNQQIFKCDDGTNCAKLMVKKLN